MTEFEYHWHHIPTGKSGMSSQSFMGLWKFLEAMNGWNRDPRWKYWS